MAAITASQSHHSQIRPFDVRRDLTGVADLIETCFSQTLDVDGRRYLGQMREAARGKGFNRWVSLAASSSTLPLAGFVWVEAGKVVGNLSMVPFFSQGRRIYLIANVAVYPEYRRRGIAKALTEAALKKSRQRQVQATWLQVRDDNTAAIELYQKMGFTPRARRTTWNANPEFPRRTFSAVGSSELPRFTRVAYRRARYWPAQKNWLGLNYPPTLRWHFSLKLQAMKPGLWGWLNKIFTETDVRHWAVERENELLGVITWQASGGQYDRLWLAAPPENEAETLRAVIPYMVSQGRMIKPFSLDYPVDRARETLLSLGFKPKQTLIWMESKT